jgi:hypothetical protein
MSNTSSKHNQGSCHFFFPLIHLSLTLLALANLSRLVNCQEDISPKFYFGLSFSIIYFI